MYTFKYPVHWGDVISRSFGDIVVTKHKKKGFMFLLQLYVSTLRRQTIKLCSPHVSKGLAYCLVRSKVLCCIAG